ncbi:MAG: DegT/DnrJ/EryC1/StrS family aminotransferase [Deltaproteobacteria bacterium]|nr:DegT/DnrJ/EryC1/StrS family aminotransferase [Deltaproteobacteria bacterium]
MEYIQFCKPYLESQDVACVTEVLKSGWIGTGPKTKLFENEFCRFTGAKHAIALNSCTAGLHLALQAIGIQPGDEVITSPLTFCATANVIAHVRAKPVFADIDPKTFNIDPIEIEKKITPKTKAIIPVHFAGHPCPMDAILDLAQQYQLRVIEDAAHALESWYHGKKIGNIGDFTAFSFYATKNITTGEGGMLTTNSEEDAARVRVLSLHGMSQDAWKRYQVKGITVHFEVLEAGYKYNMFDIQAALGLSQLERIDKLYMQRQRLYHVYDQALKDVPEIRLQEHLSQMVHGCHLFVILLDLEALRVDRDTFRHLLHEHQIGTGIHFSALHLQPFYRRTYHYGDHDFPMAEQVSSRILSLPLYLGLTNEQIDYVIDTLKKLLKKYRR